MFKKNKKGGKLLRRFKHLKKDLPAVYLSMKDSRTPLLAKIVGASIVIYALSPIDLIPDFIPFVGYLDDILILPFLMYIQVKLIPYEVWQEAQEKSEMMWINGKPKKWIYAIPIILFWILIIIYLVHLFLKK